MRSRSTGRIWPKAPPTFPSRGRRLLVKSLTVLTPSLKPRRPAGTSTNPKSKGSSRISHEQASSSPQRRPWQRRSASLATRPSPSQLVLLCLGRLSSGRPPGIYLFRQLVLAIQRIGSPANAVDRCQKIRPNYCFIQTTVAQTQ
jgi:hypothetical protein